MLYNPKAHQPKSSQLLSDLTAARGFIDTGDKWTKFAFSDGNASVCLIGAVGKVLLPEVLSDFDPESSLDPVYKFYFTKNKSEKARRLRKMVNALYKQLPEEDKDQGQTDPDEKSSCLQNYNDCGSRKHSDITDLFDRAIQAEVVRITNKEMVCS